MDAFLSRFLAASRAAIVESCWLGLAGVWRRLQSETCVGCIVILPILNADIIFAGVEVSILRDFRLAVILRLGFLNNISQ